MKKQMQKIRRFLVRTKRYEATAARAIAPAHAEDDDDGGNRLSAAFIVVLALHVIAIVGVFAFARIKDSRKTLAGPDPAAQPTATKSAPKPAAAKPAAPKAVASIPATTPSPTPAPPRELLKTPPATGRVHIVQSGENLIKIALAYGVGVPELQNANKLKNSDIRAGQSLTIPEPKAPVKVQAVAETKPATPTHKPAENKTPKTYTVKKGDTVAKIAREIGCKYEDLARLNSIKDPKKIQPGHVLKLPVKNG
jgi:LysM repeat protein